MLAANAHLLHMHTCIVVMLGCEGTNAHVRGDKTWRL